MTKQPPERTLAKFLGLFSFALGVAQLAVPDRVNKLIGVQDKPKARAIQRAVGVQELTAAQGIFAFSPPTPVLWARVAGDIMHIGLVAQAFDNKKSDKAKLGATIGALVGIGVLDTFVSARYQSAWPKEPTQGEPLPTRADSTEIEAKVPGNPSITILASEADIRPRLQELEIASYGDIVFRPAPGDRGTELVVQTNKNSEKVKAELRRVKQLVEVGEIVRSEGAPEGSKAKRQLFQRPAQPLNDKEFAKAGGRS
jgi:hypothetical protein